MDGKDIDNRFTYHAPRPERKDDFIAIREKAKDMAHTVNALVPEGREKSLAMTHIEEAVMWANAGIAREKKE